METILEDNMYMVDLGNINTASEVIFELSSILDKDEIRNKKIYLKLGSVDLNQAQLLSIKSLISGIESFLTCIDTKSVETEKVALSLGIIVSNVSAENIIEVTPEMPYKTADELKDKNKSSAIVEEKEDESFDIIEEETEESPDKTAENKFIDNNESYDIQTEEKSVLPSKETITSENSVHDEGITEEETIETETEKTTESFTADKKDEIKDELDVIFSSNPSKSNIFEMAVPEVAYEEKDGLDDIVVPEHEYTKEDIELEASPTKYIKQTIRSGQVINYEGNIVIIGDCHPGSEIKAFGDITVWGILSGIAHAGAGGNQKARVRALKMNAIQLRIANCYSRRPDSLNTVFVEKTNSFTPEEARIINNEIVVFKIND